MLTFPLKIALHTNDILPFHLKMYAQKKFVDASKLLKFHATVPFSVCKKAPCICHLEKTTGALIHPIIFSILISWEMTLPSLFALSLGGMYEPSQQNVREVKHVTSRLMQLRTDMPPPLLLPNCGNLGSHGLKWQSQKSEGNLILGHQMGECALWLVSDSGRQISKLLTDLWKVRFCLQQLLLITYSNIEIVFPRFPLDSSSFRPYPYLSALNESMNQFIAAKMYNF